MKSKDFEEVSDVISHIKDLRLTFFIAFSCFSDLASPAEERPIYREFRLETAKKLLSSTTFNGRMNALKEVETSMPLFS